MASRSKNGPFKSGFRNARVRVCDTEAEGEWKVEWVGSTKKGDAEG